MKWSALLWFTLFLFPVAVYAHGAEHGGQAVEVQGYNLELVAEPEAKYTHIHLYLMDAKDKIVSTAQVKLQVMAPDGKKLALPLVYDVKENSYTANLAMTAKGIYKAVVLTSVAGKKLNARYTFKI